MKFTYKDKEIELKYSFRAMMIYENIVHKSFKPESLSDVIVFFYSTVIAQMREDVIQFDEFIDYLDEHPELLNDFSSWLLETATATDVKTKEAPAKKGRKKTKEVEDPNQ